MHGTTIAHPGECLVVDRVPNSLPPAFVYPLLRKKERLILFAWWQILTEDDGFALVFRQARAEDRALSHHQTRPNAATKDPPKTVASWRRPCPSETSVTEFGADYLMWDCTNLESLSSPNSHS
ncbi:unnamed protein product [Calypogeia fissa]